MSESVRNWSDMLDRNRQAAGMKSFGAEAAEAEAKSRQSLLSALESLAGWLDKDFDKADSGRPEGIQAAEKRIGEILGSNRPTVEEMVKLCAKAKIKRAEDVLEVVRLMGMNNTEAVIRVMKMVEQEEHISFE